jgi:type I restriction enzyme S subunit
MSAKNLITQHLDTWTQAIETKSTAGRGSSNKLNLVGIQKLRELILEMAVRGLLVRQESSDEPASELLEKIAAEKAQLIKDKKIKKTKALPEIGEDEKPFDLPSGWAWKRLPEIYFNISPSGKKLKTSDILEVGEFPVVDQGQNYISGYFNDQSLLIEIPRKVVIFGDHTTNLKLIDFNFIAGADGTKIMCPIQLDEKYFYRFLTSLKLDNRGYGRHFKILNENLIAIPPLEEQKRIVAKVDELMALCDQLESRTLDSIATHQTLVETLLGNLVNPENTANFDQAWSLIAQNFDVLFTTEHSIETLKQTILQLAVMGKLVPQNPNDEPAGKLLKKIAAEKAQLIKDKKIKKTKPLPEITEADKPFDLPCGWEWVRLQDLLSKIGAGSTPSGGQKAYVDEGIKFLRSQNVWNDGLNLLGVALIPESIHEKMSGTQVQAGDLLFNITGASIGRCALVPEDFDTANVSQHVTIVRSIDKEIKAFLHIILISKHVQQTVMDVQVGVSREGLSISKLGAFLIPVPPKAEQQRIVAKVNELMTLCDQLKTQMQAAQQTQIHLAKSIAQETLL